MQAGRRSTLWVLAGILISLAGGLAALVAGFVGNAIGRPRDRSWADAGPASELGVSNYQKRVLRTERRHAWRRRELAFVVYLRLDAASREPRAILSTCSHLGCSVQWLPADAQFHCPCHGGVFDADGAVLAGPPPAALRTLRSRVEDGRCLVELPAEGGVA